MQNRLITSLVVAFGIVASPLIASAAFAADKKGSFRSNKSYKVSGRVTVDKNGTIRLTGFRTTSGPDLYIYVGNGSPTTRVAKLKRTSGNQTYKISASLAKSISTVHVHCKRYNSLFGTARVK